MKMKDRRVEALRWSVRTVLPLPSSYSRHHATTANHLCASTPPPPQPPKTTHTKTTNCPKCLYSKAHQLSAINQFQFNHLVVIEGAVVRCEGVPFQTPPTLSHTITKKFCRKTSQKKKRKHQPEKTNESPHGTQTNTHHRHLLPPSSSRHYHHSYHEQHSHACLHAQLSQRSLRRRMQLSPGIELESSDESTVWSGQERDQ